jgi:replication initiation and membrane attachment protein
LADVKIVEGLLLDYQLLPGVANVLIDYVMLRNDMKLNKALVDKIAGHWARKQVKTVKEAMELARQEYKKSQEFKQANEGSVPTPAKKGRKPTKNTRRDKLPKWLLEEKQGKQAVEPVEHDPEFEEKKKQFEMMLKQRREKKTGED